MKRKLMITVAILCAVYGISYLGLRAAHVLVHVESYAHIEGEAHVSNTGLTVDSHTIRTGGNPPKQTLLSELVYAPLALAEVGGWYLVTPTGTEKPCSCYDVAMLDISPAIDDEFWYSEGMQALIGEIVFVEDNGKKYRHVVTSIDRDKGIMMRQIDPIISESSTGAFPPDMTLVDDRVVE